MGLYSDFPIRGSLPSGIQQAKSGRVGIVISYQTEKMLFQNTLVLVPQRLSLGIGCRKGAAAEQIAQAVETVCAAFSYPLTAICEAASIDLKAEEAGLLAFCQKLRVPVRFYSAEVLRQVQGNFSASSFVAGVTGVDNVCERAAIKSSGGRLLVPKQVVHSVTVALAERCV